MANITVDFIDALSALPLDAPIPEAIDTAIGPALYFEKRLRNDLNFCRSFDNPYIGLINVFDVPQLIQTSRPRQSNSNSEYLLPLTADSRRDALEPSCVGSITDFRTNLAIFSYNVLRRLTDWDHMVIAGGSVLASLMHFKNVHNGDDLLSLYHGPAYESADVDIFLWWMSPMQAEEKIIQIFQAMKASCHPWDVVAVRKEIYLGQFPRRHVQIVLALYDSPREILTGFDVDCASVCYDGTHVWATPRAMASIISQSNKIDMTRRSPLYEIRLAKYARRGFEIHYPPLCRDAIRPRLTNRGLGVMPSGLGRLIVYEKFFANERHYHSLKFSKQPRRGNGDLLILKGNEDFESSDYDTVTIPYNIHWTAKRVKWLSIELECKMRKYIEALHLREPTNPDGYLHRHIMVAGPDIYACLYSNLCSMCPVPRDEIAQQVENANDKCCIRGAIRFKTHNPGEQCIGSFNPINDDEWERDAYYGPY